MNQPFEELMAAGHFILFESWLERYFSSYFCSLLELGLQQASGLVDLALLSLRALVYLIILFHFSSE